MKAHGVVVGHDGTRAGRRLRCESSSAARETEPLEGSNPDVVVREDQYVAPGQRFVAADVVRVHMGIDQEADLAGRHATHRGNQPVGERREQGIDQQDAVLAGKEADVAAAAGPLHHVDPAPRGNDRQLDARERIGRVLLPGDSDDHDASHGQSGQNDTGLSGHG